MEAKSILFEPSWEVAVGIYMAVLENPDAPSSVKQGAREDMLKLARFVDCNTGVSAGQL